MKYPTLAELSQANLAQCKTWASTLPAPQTDVERTIHRRLTVRVNAPTAADILAKIKEALLRR